MSEEKKNEVTEEVKEARKLTEEDLEQVTGGLARHSSPGGAPDLMGVPSN